MKIIIIMSWIAGLTCILLGVLTPLNFALFTGMGVGIILLTTILKYSVKMQD